MDQATRDYLKAQMDRSIELLPQHMRGGFYRYVLDRIEGGSFMTAVLANDLKGAYQRADHINKLALPQIVEFIVSTLPIGCHGSHEKVQAWLNAEDENTIDEVEHE